ncbi:MAG: hypothetical protein AAGF11_51330 [Myxococcota bacterium]
MASFTQITQAKRRAKQKKAGRARKLQQGQRSTQSYDELFAGCGEPRDAEPKAASSED